MRFFGTLLFLCLPGIAFGQGDPTIGFNQFPQFRNLSGLSGGGYGLDEWGRGSLSGATAYSTPIAYVLGHDQVRLNIGYMSFDSLPRFSSDNINGSGTVVYGHTFGSFNVAISDMFKSNSLDQAYNLQVGFIPPRHWPVTLSVGVQDWQGNGGSAGETEPTDKNSAQSYFGVMTYKIATKRSPLYVSLGVGTHRFARVFESASYQVLEPLRVWVEQDGYGVNFGLLYTYKPHKSPSSFEWNTTVGFVKGQYFTIFTGIGF